MGPRDLPLLPADLLNSRDASYLERWAAQLGVTEEWSAVRSRVGW